MKELPKGTRLKSKKGNIFVTLDKPYLYETKYPTDTWWKVKARSLVDGKIYNIRLDNFTKEAPAHD